MRSVQCAATSLPERYIDRAARADDALQRFVEDLRSALRGLMRGDRRGMRICRTSNRRV